MDEITWFRNNHERNRHLYRHIILHDHSPVLGHGAGTGRYDFMMILTFEVMGLLGVFLFLPFAPGYPLQHLLYCFFSPSTHRDPIPNSLYQQVEWWTILHFDKHNSTQSGVWGVGSF